MRERVADEAVYGVVDVLFRFVLHGHFASDGLARESIHNGAVEVHRSVLRRHGEGCADHYSQQ